MKSPFLLVLMIVFALLAQARAEPYSDLPIKDALNHPTYSSILEDARKEIINRALLGEGNGLVFSKHRPVTYNQILTKFEDGFKLHLKVEMVDVCDDVYNIECDVYAVGGFRIVSNLEFSKKGRLSTDSYQSWFGGITRGHANYGRVGNFRGQRNH